LGEDNKKNKYKTGMVTGKKGKPEGNYIMSDCRIIDMTAYKLEKMLEANSHDEWLHQALLDILGDYYMGLIAIGWENGQPMVMPMNSGTFPWKGGIPPGFSVMSHNADQISERGLEVDEEMEIVFTPEPPSPPEVPDGEDE